VNNRTIVEKDLQQIADMLLLWRKRRRLLLFRRSETLRRARVKKCTSTGQKMHIVAKNYALPLPLVTIIWSNVFSLRREFY